MKVTAILQAEGYDAVEQRYAGGITGTANDLDVIESVTQLLKADKDESPWSPRVRRIVIEISDVVEYTCEHGMSKELCADPITHYPPDRDEPPF